MANQVKDAPGITACLKGTVGRHLVDDSVGHRVRERNPELDDISTGSLQSVHDLKRAVHIRIASANVGNKGSFPLFLKGCEALIDAILLTHETAALSQHSAKAKPEIIAISQLRRG